jgi:hypothetical protein
MSEGVKRLSESAGEGVAVVAVLWVGLKGAGRWRLLARLSGHYSSERSEREYVAERAPAAGGFLRLRHRVRTIQKAPPGSEAAARCAPRHAVPAVLTSSHSPSLSPLSVPPTSTTTAPHPPQPIRPLPPVVDSSLVQCQLVASLRSAHSPARATFKRKIRERSLTSVDHTRKNRTASGQYTSIPWDSRACSRRSSVLSNSSPHVHV